jgi:hypothetical protein
VCLLAINSWILPTTGIKIPLEFAPAMDSPWFQTRASRPRNPCCGIPVHLLIKLLIYTKYGILKVKDGT